MMHSCFQSNRLKHPEETTADDLNQWKISELRLKKNYCCVVVLNSEKQQVLGAHSLSFVFILLWWHANQACNVMYCIAQIHFFLHFSLPLYSKLRCSIIVSLIRLFTRIFINKKIFRPWRFCIFWATNASLWANTNIAYTYCICGCVISSFFLILFLLFDRNLSHFCVSDILIRKEKTRTVTQTGS